MSYILFCVFGVRDFELKQGATLREEGYISILVQGVSYRRKKNRVNEGVKEGGGATVLRSSQHEDTARVAASSKYCTRYLTK